MSLSAAAIRSSANPLLFASASAATNATRRRPSPRILASSLVLVASLSSLVSSSTACSLPPPSFPLRSTLACPAPATAPAAVRSIMSSSAARTSNAPGWVTHPNPYPAARRDDSAATTYKSAAHGQVTVPEPYQWLETPPSQSQETKDWVQAQAALTKSYLDGCQPDLDLLKQRIQRNFDFARASNPSLKGDGRFYYSYNSGLSPQSLIYRASEHEVQQRTGKDTADPVGEVFFDVNLLDPNGTVALSLSSFSKSGKYFAYGISRSGSDWFKIHFRSTDKPFRLPADKYRANGTSTLSPQELAPYIDAEGGSDRLDDVLDDVKFSGATWTHDDRGVFYMRFPSVAVQDKGTETTATNRAQLWYHRLGTPQSDDVLVIPTDERIPESMWSTEITDDGRYLCVRNSRDTDTKSRYFVASLHDQPIGGEIKWVPLALGFEYDLDYVANVGNRFYFLSNKDASNYRLVYVDVDFATARAGPVWSLEGKDVELHDVVPEDKGALLSSATLVSDNKLLLVYSRDVKDELYQYDLESGKRVERLLPDLVGTIGQISARKEDDHAYVQFTSFINPGQIFRIDWQHGSKGIEGPTRGDTLYSSTKVAGIRSEDFVSEQVFFSSKDGTRVPMFITRPKTHVLDGSSPCLLYFYGGFNIPIQPSFVPTMMTWAASYGGVMAFVNARGGGEYGSKWHDAGRLLNKQNVFDDVLSAARFLHSEGYAAKGKVILSGGSNGGLGVAACVNQCTDEDGIGAGIADVGVHDMLKFHTFTIGKAWVADYGNPSEDPEIFDYNRGYSPLHNVDPKKTYPTFIAACADHDDRVVPAHSFKLIAEMQHSLASNPNPLLLRVELDAGHGAGKSTQKRITEAAEKYAIVARALGLKIRQEGEGVGEGKEGGKS